MKRLTPLRAALAAALACFEPLGAAIFQNKERISNRSFSELAKSAAAMMHARTQKTPFHISLDDGRVRKPGHYIIKQKSTSCTRCVEVRYGGGYGGSSQTAIASFFKLSRFAIQPVPFLLLVSLPAIVSVLSRTELTSIWRWSLGVGSRTEEIIQNSTPQE
jgi:hypothetical protein